MRTPKPSSLLIAVFSVSVILEGMREWALLLAAGFSHIDEIVAQIREDQSFLWMEQGAGRELPGGVLCAVASGLIAAGKNIVEAYGGLLRT